MDLFASYRTLVQRTFNKMAAPQECMLSQALLEQPVEVAAMSLILTSRISKDCTTTTENAIALVGSICLAQKQLVDEPFAMHKADRDAERVVFRRLLKAPSALWVDADQCSNMIKNCIAVEDHNARYFYKCDTLYEDYFE